MNTSTENSAVVRIFDYSYPQKGEALVESAIMGYGVVCYDHGYFYVVWWEDDQSYHMPLSWGKCAACSNIYASDRHLNCPDCFDSHVEIEVA